MERIEIIIRPPSSHDGRLLVVDAMQQVLDTLHLLDQAQKAMASPEDAFEWRLESASTNSPLKIVAVAEPIHAQAEVSEYVKKVTGEFAAGLRHLFATKELPWWMEPASFEVAKALFGRSASTASTEIVIAANDAVMLDKQQANAGLDAIYAAAPSSVDSELPERESLGELRGQMIAAGRYRNKAALQLSVDPYGFVWCLLSPELVQRFGGESRLDEVWGKRSLYVEGRLIYAKGGKLVRIEATDIRQRPDVEAVELDAIVDPNFTAGLDPSEYLRQLHDGQLN